MNRIGDEIRGELGRFGPQGAMADVLATWPDAVGESVARNAWPARIARDGTLHVHTQDSIWAFELTSRAEEIRARLGEHAPRRVAFAPGPLPEAVEEPGESRAGNISKPTPEHLAQADSLARGIRDEDLRKVVAKAAALSLSRAASDRSFW